MLIFEVVDVSLIVHEKLNVLFGHLESEDAEQERFEETEAGQYNGSCVLRIAGVHFFPVHGQLDKGYDVDYERDDGSQAHVKSE